MGSEDLPAAHAAGAAFVRMTGIELEGKRRTAAVAPDADAFTREFAAELWVPNAKAARKMWASNAQAWSAGTRWCRGCEVSTRLGKDARQLIDLQALWDFGARSALAGQRPFGPPPLS